MLETTLGYTAKHPETARWPDALSAARREDVRCFHGRQRHGRSTVTSCTTATLHTSLRIELKLKTSVAGYLFWWPLSGIIGVSLRLRNPAGVLPSVRGNFKLQHGYSITYGYFQFAVANLMRHIFSLHKTVGHYLI